MLKIYDRPGFPNPARIRIVVAAKGLDASVESSLWTSSPLNTSNPLT